MLKLMKYEFRKQAFSKIILLILAGILQLVFFAGILMDSEKLTSTSLVLMVVYTFGALFFLSYEAIFTFYNDLKQKCSYMLFLTPRTTYQIVGAKVVSAGIQILLAGIVLFLIFALDGVTLIAKYDSLAQVKDLIQQFIQEMFKIEISLPTVIAVVAFVITSWVSTITVGFFAITLSSTFLANTKFNGLVSFGIFIVLNIAYNYIVGRVKAPAAAANELIKLTSFYSMQAVFMLIFIIITYFGTAWMLDKKVSV